MQNRLINILLFMMLLPVMVLQCKEENPETPEKAFELFLEAYRMADAQKMASVLTEDSLASINEYLEPIQDAYRRMGDGEQAQKAFAAMARQMGVPVNKLGSITAIDYLGYTMKIENQGKGGDSGLIPKELLENPKITRSEINDTKAKLYFGEFGSIPLKKTPKGWKVQLLLNMEAPPPQDVSGDYINPGNTK